MEQAATTAGRRFQFPAIKPADISPSQTESIANEILMHFRSLRKTAGDLSLSESIDTDKDGNTLSLMDIISVEDDMLENISSLETVKQLHAFINQALTPREREIMIMRYGICSEHPLTQREVAAVCGISRSYVSRIEKKALEKLRKCFEDTGN